MSEADLKELAESIKTNGLRELITLTKDGQLLDGRCRLEACAIAGVEPRTEIYEGDDYVGFVLDKNKHRRHLNKSQLGRIVADLVAQVPNGRPKKETFRIPKSFSDKPQNQVEELAKKAGVGESSVRYGIVLRDKAARHIDQMVKDGLINAQTAAEAVRYTPRETQANWTIDDVKREGLKVRAEQSGNPAKSTTAGKVAKVKKKTWRNNFPKGNHLYQVPYHTTVPSVSDRDIGTERRIGQPVTLWPVHIQDLMNDSITVGNAAGSIPAWLGHFQCTREQFIAAAERLLAYQPVLHRPDGRPKDNGEQNDYAAKLRKEFKYIETKLVEAYAWLDTVRDTIVKANQAVAPTPITANGCVG